jgi:radical SAM protein with 4Fe4S-binding SPASM domain
MNWHLFEFMRDPGKICAFAPHIPSWFVCDKSDLGILKTLGNCTFANTCDYIVPPQFTHFIFNDKIKNSEINIPDEIIKKYKILLGRDIRKHPEANTNTNGLCHCAVICLTSRCNLNCSYCSANGLLATEPDPSTDEILSRIQWCSDHSIEHILFTGGEPFIRSDCIEILDGCISKGIAFEVNTNGYYFTNDIVHALQKLQNNNHRIYCGEQCPFCYSTQITDSPFCDFCLRPVSSFVVRVSIDAGSEQVNDSQRGKGSYRTAVETLKKLSEIGVCAIPSVTITAQSLHSLFGLIDLAHNLSLPNIRIIPISPHGNASRNWKTLQPSSIETASVLLQLNEYIKSNNYSIFIDYMNKKKSYCYGCLVHQGCSGCNNIYIDSNGEIYPCDQLIAQQYRIGTINDPFESLSRNKNEIINGVQTLAHDVAQCQKCLYQKICNSGCPGHKLGLGQKTNSPDPYCDFYMNLYTNIIEESLTNYRSPRNLARNITNISA